MPKRSCVLFLCVLFLSAAAPGGSQAESLSGKWETSYCFNRIVVDVQSQGMALQGVLYLYTPSGEKRTYHFSGSLSEGRLVAKHYSGHAFYGRFEEPASIVGTLTTKTGTRLPIHLTDLHRIQ